MTTSPVVKLGQPPVEYLKCIDLPPDHWWARFPRWLADLIGRT